MLETIKHAFEVERVVFVLALNRRQLERAASVVYGAFADPESYFRKFFDVELRLPEGNRRAVVRAVMERFGVPVGDVPGDMLEEFLAASPFGIRVIQQTIQHYEVVRASLQGSDPDDWWWMLPTFMLLRLIDEEPYRRFIAGQMSDGEVVDSVLTKDWVNPLQDSGSANLLSAATALAAEVRGDKSTLLRRYEEDLGIGLGFHDSPSDDSVAGWYLGLTRGRTVSRRTQTVRRVAGRIDMLDLGGELEG